VSRLFLLLAIAAVIYILFKRAQALPPKQRKAQYTKLGVAAMVVLVAVLAVMGKMHWIGVALTGLLVAARQLLPTLIRVFPMLASYKSRSAAGGGGQRSTVETNILRMELDHENGTLDGEVLKGNYQGERLAGLDKEQLRELLDYCQGADSESVQLLRSYLQQRFSGDEGFAQNRSGPVEHGAINRSEALAVLGLEENAEKAEIIAAHRKLMQRMHPDRGGSDYLAAKINQAKDYLLG
jgi:hypothetical protein